MKKVFFDNLQFKVPEKVYLPREDSFLAGEYLQRMDLKGKKVLDLGTGSGFLGIIASKKGGIVDCADLSPLALDTAELNAELNEVELNVFKTDLFSNISEKYDVILFNAPYLPDKVDKEDLESLTWAGGEDGREVLDKFLEKCSDYLEEKGVIIFVQSSLTGRDETFSKLEEEGFDGEVVMEEKVDWENLLVFKGSLRDSKF